MTVWMVYALAFGALSVVAGFALDLGARALKQPARFVWLAMLVAAIVGPFALSSLTGVPVGGAKVEIAQGASASAGPIVPMAGEASWIESMRRRARDFDRPLLLLWVALSAFCLGRFVSGVLSLRRRRPQWVARDIAGTQCFVTPDIGPAVVAMPETRIVVPEWALSLDPESLATVIRHERQHEVARDGWLIVTSAIGTALMPWNPAVWIIQRRLRLAIEMDCDARVLAEEPRVDRYGSLLLAIAQRPRLVAGLGATLAESTSDLERRIDAMTARPSKHPRARAFLFAATGVAAIAVACSIPAPDMVAPQAVNPSAQPVASSGVFFDFQVEKPVSANPGNMPPRYPEQLRAAGIQGSVVAKFVVDTNGRADMNSFEVLKADHEGFVTAVREALPDMRFFPAQVGGRKVKQLIQMPFSFSMVRGGTPEVPAGVGRAVDTPKPRVVFEERSVDPATKKTLSRSELPLPPSTPRLLEGGAPVYPNVLRAAGIQGMVQAKFVIRPDGKADMRTFEVVRSDHEEFTAAVRASVERARWEPPTVNGKAVSQLISMPYVFSLSK